MLALVSFFAIVISIWLFIAELEIRKRIIYTKGTIIDVEKREKTKSGGHIILTIKYINLEGQEIIAKAEAYKTINTHYYKKIGKDINIKYLPDDKDYISVEHTIVTYMTILNFLFMGIILLYYSLIDD